MMDTFGPLNPRTASMRERILDTQPTVCTERAILTTKAYRAHEQEQVILRRAYTLDAVLRGMSIYIDVYKRTTEYVNNNIPEAAQLVEQYDIVKAAVAEQAIPYCNIVYIRCV